MGTALEIRAPAEHTEGTRSQVLRWLKAVGETVNQNEPLVEIETDKVTVEIASPGAGVLREIVKGEQEEVIPGEVLGRLEVNDSLEIPLEKSGSATTSGDRRSDASATPAAHAAIGANGITRGTSVPTVSDGIAQGPTTATPPVHPDASIASMSDSAAMDTRAEAPVGTSDKFAVTRLSPAVRRLLSENALDPSRIRGKGLGGRITVDDVLAAVAAARAGTPSVNGAAADVNIVGGSHRIPHTAVRKRIADHMVQSLLHTAPHVTTVFEADMTAVLTHRARHREEFARRGVSLTLTAYFLLAIVDAVRVVPEANSRWTDSALEIFDSIHIGVGTALEGGGLVVPVLRDVQSRDLFSIAEGLGDLVTRARGGRLTPADVRGGTITISNHGVSGSLLATPIVINQPQSAILGIGKLEKRPVVVEEGGEDRVVVRPRCYVTLTIDHRVMDGHQANRFLETFVSRLGNGALEPV